VKVCNGASPNLRVPEVFLGGDIETEAPESKTRGLVCQNTECRGETEVFRGMVVMFLLQSVETIKA
jgi:hypothetical protein